MHTILFYLPLFQKAKLLLYDERYNSLERELSVVNKRKDGDSSLKSKIMFGIWRCDNEITLLLEEGDVDRFPEGKIS